MANLPRRRLPKKVRSFDTQSIHEIHYFSQHRWFRCCSRSYTHVDLSLTTWASVFGRTIYRGLVGRRE